MQLWLVDASGRSHSGNHLATADTVTATNQQFLIMGISSHPSARVLDQQHVAEATQLVPGIGDNTVIGGAYRGTDGSSDVNAIVETATALGAKIRDDSPFDRPDEEARGSRGRWRPVRRTAAPRM